MPILHSVFTQQSKVVCLHESNAKVQFAQVLFFFSSRLVHIESMSASREVICTSPYIVYLYIECIIHIT